MAEARAEFDTGLVYVEFPYDAELVVRLKDELPWHARTWDGNRRVWKISAGHWSEAEKIIEEFYPIIT